ncbi:MAG: 3-dehydroquinate synthase [Rhodospirillales bacterium]|nr:3-dehydroquinate synthase [Rhodospirillales bacterium]
MNTQSPISSQNEGRLRVELGERSYDIVVGEKLLDQAGGAISGLMKGNRAVIVTDANVAPLYLQRLEESLSAAAIEHSAITLPAGEQSKSFEHLQALTDKLFQDGVDRKTMLIALGGGVIGDLAGFAAAITMRGIEFVQIPTTFLSQVDSSVGGKTGINSPYGKNLIGAFHQPRLVLADLETLETLPRRQLLAGYGEVVKYGLINDPDFFSWLEENGAALLDGDRALQCHAVLKSCTSKAAVVAADEREFGVRALLNLGHTFGHALEAEIGYGDSLLHGEAVSIGMAMAFDLSQRMGLCPKDDALRVRNHLAKVGLPTDLKELDTASWTPGRLMAHMGLDKKAEAGTIIFVLARAIGEAFITGEVDPDELRSFLADTLN